METLLMTSSLCRSVARRMVNGLSRFFTGTAKSKDEAAAPNRQPLVDEVRRVRNRFGSREKENGTLCRWHVWSALLCGELVKLSSIHLVIPAVYRRPPWSVSHILTILGITRQKFWPVSCFFYLNFPDWAYFHIWMISFSDRQRMVLPQPVQLAIPPARLAPYLFPPVPVKSISSWSFTWSLSLPSCFYSWQSPLLEFIQHVCGVFFFFLAFFKISMCVWSIICQALFRLLEYISAQNRQKSLPSWNRPPWADAFPCLSASSGNRPHPWRSAQIPVQIRGLTWRLVFENSHCVYLQYSTYNHQAFSNHCFIC